MSLISALRLTNSNVVKQRLINQHSTELWKKVFLYAYHPDMKFGINRLSDAFHTIGEPSEEMFTLLDKLNSRELTGNAAFETVKNFMDSHGGLIALICRKDLNCGITATTLNKIYGAGFIPVFKVQLAEAMPIEKVKLPVVAQIKYDGVRITALITKDGVVCKTRNGNIVPIPNLESQLMYAGSVFEDLMIDGEIVVGEGLSVDRTSVSGKVNSAIQGTPLNMKGLVFKVFDAMPKKDFDNSKCDLTYTQRWELAKQFVESLNTDREGWHGDANGVELAETTECHTHKEIEDLYAKYLGKGLEGLILKHWDHLYKFKRSLDWIKIKEVKDCTLICVDIEEGELGTKYQGYVGALFCEGLVEGKFVKVRVGSGLSDEDRTVQSPLTHYIGEKIDVKYNSIIQSKATGEWSLFLPRFVTIRKDI